LQLSAYGGALTTSTTAEQRTRDPVRDRRLGGGVEEVETRDSILNSRFLVGGNLERENR